jgi:hypothetical protein
MEFLNRLIAATMVIAAGLATSVSTVSAQGATAPELTAAFLVNFVKFTTWPESALALDAPIALCVAGNDRVAVELETQTASLTIGGHPVAIRSVKHGSAITACHVFYVSDLDGKHVDQMLREAANQPILTVSDAKRFAERGGIAGFFVEQGKMRFAVNTAAADRARLRISSKLLSLSKIVKDERHADSR